MLSGTALAAGSPQRCPTRTADPPRATVRETGGNAGSYFYENPLPVKRESFDLVVNAAGIPIFYPSIGSGR